jgi:hypothetical protein
MGSPGVIFNRIVSQIQGVNRSKYSSLVSSVALPESLNPMQAFSSILIPEPDFEFDFSSTKKLNIVKNYRYQLRKYLFIIIKLQKNIHPVTQSF